MRARRLPLILALSLAATALVACGDSDGDGTAGDGTLVAAASFYPIEEVVRQVGGEAVQVVSLVPPGEEAHEYEPTPKQLAELSEADVVFYLGQGFQPNLEKALESLPTSVQRVDLLDGIELLPVTEQLPGTEGEAEGEELATGDDPHVWLAPGNMRQMSATVLATLKALAPDDAEAFTGNQGDYGAELDLLDTAFADGLRDCTSRVLVSAHRAFGYLADAYDLTAVAIAGVSPSEEPSAKTLEAIAAFAGDNGVTTIFFEENLPEDLAATLASEIGATTGVLDTLESPSKEQLDAGDGYDSLMRENLEALRTGLSCT